MDKKYLLGIDIGTSSCKVAVFDYEGNAVATASCAYSVRYPHKGWAQQDPSEWYAAVCTSVRKIFRDGKILPEEIAGIGIDGQSGSAVAVDKEGQVLTDTPIWLDTRTQSICDRINDKIGRDRIFDLSGNPLQPSYTTPKIIWYKENLPEVYSKIYKIFQSNGYIVFKLTGAVTQDVSQGYGLHCFNMRTGEWDKDMCDRIGIPQEFLPDIYPCHQIIGTVTKQAAAECGLVAGTPVVAGGLDAACGTLGVGVINPGETQEQGGQAGGMSICLDEYKSDSGLLLSFHVVPGKWLLQGGTVGGSGVMKWFEQNFADLERSRQEETGRNSFEQLNDIAEKVPPGSDGLVLLPYMAGERSPLWNPKAKGVFYGLDFSKTRAHMVRACMEGVAFSLRHNLEVAENAGAGVKVLCSMGGAANSVLWTQIKSDVTGKPIVVPAADTASTLGAAILAGVGTGFYDSFEEAVKVAIHQRRYHEPDMEVKKVYDKLYRIYRDLYEALKDIMNRGANTEMS